MTVVDMSCGSFEGHPVVAIGPGLLAVGHRPRLRDIPRLRAAGFTHVVSVLSSREDPASIRSACEQTGLRHFSIPIGSTKSLPKRRKPEVLEALEELTGVLRASGRIYLHCSAGIHRTGMIAAALLFYCGADSEAVRRLLSHLRPITARDMGEARFDWAASFAPTAEIQV